MGEEENRVFGCPRENESFHRTKFKAPEKLYAEKRLIRPFSAMQHCLALAEAKLRRSGARERWREPARAEENTTGDIQSPPADTTPTS
jgi:hypothetical protein